MKGPVTVDFLEKETTVNGISYCKSIRQYSPYDSRIYAYIQVVSWDTAGALWASGNDASAPKPCLNPESSSDEGFVRSNAVVQT